MLDSMIEMGGVMVAPAAASARKPDAGKMVGGLDLRRANGLPRRRADEARVVRLTISSWKT